MDCFYINPIWHGPFIVQFGKRAMTVIESWTVIFTTPSPAIVFKIGITLKSYKPETAFWVISDKQLNPCLYFFVVG